VIKNLRNAGIILAIALAVIAVPGGGTAATFISALLSTVFFALLAWFGWRLYREHRFTLDSLPDRYRLTLYGAIAVVVLTVTATARLWATGFGTVVWIVLIACSAYAVYLVWRASRSY
jgi:hypothetical protein